MRHLYSLIVVTITLGACVNGSAVSSRSSSSVAVNESLYSNLNGPTCIKTPDVTDPNETPYWVCPGVGGYNLVVRRVDAGKRSVDVVDAVGRSFPLDIPKFVTPNMYLLGDKAAWRVKSVNGRAVPVALIIRVGVFEKTPGKVSRTLVAIAKISSDMACLTEVISENELTEDSINEMADFAGTRTCVTASARP